MGRTRFADRLFRTSRTSSSSRRRGCRPTVAVERLEDRTLLSAFFVNTTDDAVDVNPGDGFAADAQGRTTLRAAVMEANALGGSHSIELGAATSAFSLTISGANEDASATGDLDIHSDLTIVGAGADLTLIHANGLDRIFDVYRDGGLHLSGAAVTGGRVLGGTNVKDEWGGAMRIDFFTAVTIDKAEFRNNSAIENFGAGGAIQTSGQLTILNSRFENNFADNNGGAIYVNGSGATTTIRDTTFANNTAPSGGAIFNHHLMTIENCTFVGNSAGSFEGGNGGAINNNGGELTLVNSTIAGNASAFGGGIYNSGSITIRNTTIAGNSADWGGGISVTSVSSGVTLENSIVADNVATIEGPDIRGEVTSLGHNLIGDTTGTGGFVATDLLNIDPLLGPLADNGGSTQTIGLLSGSPAIDAANTATAPPTDQRGVSRPQGAAADIGAFERVNLTAVVDTLVDEDDGNYGPGDLSLREAVRIVAAGETITFAESLAGGTLTLTLGHITLDRSVAIAGLGATRLTLSGGGSSQIFYVGSDATVTISNLTLTEGWAEGFLTEERYGGAIYSRGNLTLEAVNATNNRASLGGGAVFSGGVYGDGPRFLRVIGGEFGGNSASFGGAIESEVTLDVMGTAFFSNTAGSQGGAITSKSRLSVSGGVFSGNRSSNGAAIYYSSRLGATITATTFLANSADGLGGALFNNGIMWVADTAFVDNTADSGGGAIRNNGTLVVMGSTLSRNSSASSGGAVDSLSYLTFVNSTFSGNSAAGNGGALSLSLQATLRNVTIFGNTAAAGIGGIYVHGGILRLDNSIVAANNGGDIHVRTEWGASLASGSRNNLVSDAATSGGLTNGVNGNIVGVDWTTVIDPVLKDNGGPTLTHALLGSGAAVNAGSDAEAIDPQGNPLTGDQRGFPRFVGTVDIGAFELQDAPPVFDQPSYTFSLAENSPSGTSVGIVSATDPDGDVLTYAIISGNESGAFAIDPTTGRITVADGTALDYETTPEWTLTVRVSDPGGLADEGVVTIGLTDVVDESPAPVIDIAPGDATNTITAGKGTVQVAILSDATFDATTIVIDSLRFGRTGTENSLARKGNGAARYGLSDVNGDGRLDLLVWFDVSLAGFQVGDTVGLLTGHTADGQSIESSDSVVIEEQRGGGGKNNKSKSSKLTTEDVFAFSTKEDEEALLLGI